MTTEQETKAYNALFDAVERLKALKAERDELRQQYRETEERARAFGAEVVRRYQTEENALEERRKQAEAENNANRAEIVKLSKQRIQAEISGAEFAGAERLEALEKAVTVYPLQAEALEQLQLDVKITRQEQETLSAIHAEGYKIGAALFGNASRILELADDMRNHFLLDCVGGLDLVLIQRQADLLPDMYKEIHSMRKEDFI